MCEFLLEEAVLVDEDGAVIIPEHVEDPELASAKEIPGWVICGIVSTPLPDPGPLPSLVTGANPESQVCLGSEGSGIIIISSGKSSSSQFVHLLAYVKHSKRI